MQKYYAGTIDPVNGQVINPGSERGNETDNVLALGLAFSEELPEPAFDGLFYWVFGPSFGHPASAVNFANFDFHHDVDTVDDQLAEVLNADSSELGEFREHGGKLLMYHGWADPLIPSQSSINYFNALVGGDNRDPAGELHAATRRCSGPRATPGCSWCPGCTTAPAAPAPTCSMRSPRSDLGRDWRGAGDDRRHQVRQRYAARSPDDPAALRLPQSREIQRERQHRRCSELHLRRRQPDLTRPPPRSSGHEEYGAGEPHARRGTLCWSACSKSDGYREHQIVCRTLATSRFVARNDCAPLRIRSPFMARLRHAEAARQVCLSGKTGVRRETGKE